MLSNLFFLRRKKQEYAICSEQDGELTILLLQGFPNHIFELGKVKDHPIASEQRIIAEELCSFLQDNVLNDRISLVNANKLPSNRYIVNGDQIVLKTEVDDVARLYSISGLLVRVASGSAVWSNLPRGYYVLHINSRTAGDVIAKVQVK